MEVPPVDPLDDRRHGRGAAGAAGELGVRLRALAGGGTRYVPPNRETLLQRPEREDRDRRGDRPQVDLERRALFGHLHLQQHRVQGEARGGSLQVGGGRSAQHVREQIGAVLERERISLD